MIKFENPSYPEWLAQQQSADTANVVSIRRQNLEQQNGYRTPEQVRLDRAQRYAASVRAKHPEMQVKRVKS